MGDNAELVEFLQRLLGYGISGLAVEHVLPIFVGQRAQRQGHAAQGRRKCAGYYAG